MAIGDERLNYAERKMIGGRREPVGSNPTSVDPRLLSNPDDIGAVSRRCRNTAIVALPRRAFGKGRKNAYHFALGSAAFNSFGHGPQPLQIPTSSRAEGLFAGNYVFVRGSRFG
jgi:hypothetical protein